MVRATVDTRSTERVYADEFGSVSGDAEWAAAEMFQAALRQRFPAGLPPQTRFRVKSGLLPPLLPYDLVFDLRVLKSQGDRLGALSTASRR